MYGKVCVLLLYCTCIVAFQANLRHLVPSVASKTTKFVTTRPCTATTGDVDVQDRSQIKLKVMPFGRPHSEESKARISASNKGKVPWNTGIKHSPETKARIAERTKEAAQRRKAEAALVLGITVAEYDAMRAEERDQARRAKLKGGLTEEGKRRISESMKSRWAQPGFRDQYIRSRSGFKGHTQETKDRISALIKLKWKDENYRRRCSGRSHISDEVRRKISESLKARWLDPEFRHRMLNSTTGIERTELQKARISESVRLKWRDPAYRSAIEQSLRNRFNINTTSAAYGDIPVRTTAATSTTTTTTRSSATTVSKRQRQATRVRERKFDQEDEEERVALAHKKEEINMRLDQRASRSAVLANAKQAAIQAVQSGGTVDLKSLLGDDLWFEEKMLHKIKGQTVPTDAVLNAMLLKEWGGPVLLSSKPTVATAITTPTAVTSPRVQAATGSGDDIRASNPNNLGTGAATPGAGSSAAKSGILYAQNAQPRAHAHAAPVPVAISLSEIKQAALHSDTALDEVSARIEGAAAKLHKTITTTTTGASSASQPAARRASSPAPGARAKRTSAAPPEDDDFAEDVHGNYGRIDASYSDTNIHVGVDNNMQADDEEEDSEEDKIEVYDARGKLVGVYTPQEYERLRGGMNR